MDWVVLGIIVLFSIRGFLRGLVAQVFVVVGLAGGLAVGAWTFDWLGHHWADARPWLVYEAMRWLVTGLAALAVASLFQLWGESLGQAVRESPFGLPDRVLGIGGGAVLGLIIATVGLLTLASVTPRRGELHRALAESPSGQALLYSGEKICGWAGPVVPGGRWMAERFRSARRGKGEGRWVRRGRPADGGAVGRTITAAA